MIIDGCSKTLARKQINNFRLTKITLDAKKFEESDFLGLFNLDTIVESIRTIVAFKNIINGY